MDKLDRTVWFTILLLSILPLMCSFMQLEFMKNSTGLISVCFSLPLYFFSTILPCIVGYAGWKFESDPELKKLFHGHKRTGRIIGVFPLFIGNIGLDYFTEKSVACMLTFLFLALSFLCILCCVQPCTDFGILELLLVASSVVAFRRFGLHLNSLLVVVACVFIDVTRYWLDPEGEEELVQASEQSSSLQSGGVLARNGSDENRESRAIDIPHELTNPSAVEESSGLRPKTN